MINSNQELLNWAVKNIKMWDEEFTHIRCDSTGIYFTWGNSWQLDEDDNWGYPYRKIVSHESFIADTSVKLSPQVITREEWLEELNPTTRLVKLQRQRDLAKKVLDELDAKIKELGGEL